MSAHPTRLPSRVSPERDARPPGRVRATVPRDAIAGCYSTRAEHRTLRSLKHLLIIYHSQSGKTASMAHAVRRGAMHPEIESVEVRMRLAADAGPGDLFWCDAVIFATPENFGYMAGAMKDFFDRTFYPCQGRLQGMPYAVVVGAGNDGTGALDALRRIVRGFPLKETQEPIVCSGPLDEHVLSRCETLGATIAAGLEIGMF